ncbi:MAG: hypothetical protein ABF926_06020 [Acetobacter syzygii]
MLFSCLDVGTINSHRPVVRYDWYLCDRRACAGSTCDDAPEVAAERPDT